MMPLLHKSVNQVSEDDETIKKMVVIKLCGLPIYQYDFTDKIKSSECKKIGFAAMSEISPISDDDLYEE